MCRDVADDVLAGAVRADARMTHGAELSIEVSVRIGIGHTLKRCHGSMLLALATGSRMHCGLTLNSHLTVSYIGPGAGCSCVRGVTALFDQRPNPHPDTDHGLKGAPPTLILSQGGPYMPSSLKGAPPTLILSQGGPMRSEEIVTVTIPFNATPILTPTPTLTLTK